MSQSPCKTTFECRCCGRYVDGWSNGTVEESGWGTISRIDGPNHICPECIAKGSNALEFLREDGFDHAYVEVK